MILKAIQFRIETIAVRGALGLLRRLGPVFASNVGGALARLIGPMLPVTRVGDANLRLAMPELDAAARRRVLRSVWDNLGRTAAELPHLADLARTDSGPGWEIEGAEVLQDLASKGGPAIMVTGHIGNWELFPRVTGHFGVKVSSFYRAAANPEVDALITQLRTRAVGEGVPNFAKGSQGARAALAHLGRGGFLGMLVDQKMNDGIAAPFFGRSAMTAPAAAAFALRYRCPVIPGHVERIGPARLRLVVEPSMVLPNTGDRHADIQTLTTDINAVLEGWIRKRPGEWLWLHRRWPK
jgi:KDO2-lipid IV(A) lauroyltransferase